MDDVNHVDEPAATESLARLVVEVAELLDVMWEGARDTSPVPLSASQLRAVVALEQAAGVSLSALVRALDSTAPSVSRLCDRLEAVGFLHRAPNPSSRREVRLSLTREGHAYLADLRARRQHRLGSVVERMPAHARAALLDGLTAFRDATRALTGEPAAE
ncbi:MULTISPECIES: MarR family transcriptional regulator [Amycolatopsis]|uniref:MarR family transcriptional regulator n=1 Tax=Amycolatopsis thermalba TaxID=944492 RepID=A0ABY4NXC0_9PSEU|nr:MarR family transcriptional regulator [Amycolatopsis thermalba]